MDRSNPWDSPPRSAAWRRLVTVVVPLVVAAACEDQDPPGTSTSPSSQDSGFTGTTVGTSSPADTSDTGAH